MIAVRQRTRLIGTLVTMLAVGSLAAAAEASTSSGLYVRGAGYGHGVGMSQYGAAGYAQHGYDYRQILQKYYAQTELGKVSPTQQVTVLLKPRGPASFNGAVKVRGSKIKLNSAANYNVRVAGSTLRLVSRGHTVGSFKPPLVVTGTGPLTLIGVGTYRGSFVFRPNASGSGVMTVNSLGLDAYVQGVVSAEMPSGWPQQALDAQAVAARTYAITDGAISADFDVYDNTRSQMYGGVKAETPSGDAAVAVTRGQVVEYNGRPVTTFFFASSGGETESVQNVFTGIAPEAWLVGQPDPYDDSFNNPHYRWKLNVSLNAADAKLGKLVDGRLRGIRILKRGVSPRIIEAQVIGTKGTATATGIQLEKDLATPSTWMSFTTISTRGVQTTSTTPKATTTSTTTSTTGGSGGVGVGGRARGRVEASRDTCRCATAGRRYKVAGAVYPAAAGTAISVQRDSHRGWRRVGTGAVSRRGTYSVTVPSSGEYRVLYDGVTARKITVR